MSTDIWYVIKCTDEKYDNASLKLVAVAKDDERVYRLVVDELFVDTRTRMVCYSLGHGRCTWICVVKDMLEMSGDEFRKRCEYAWGVLLSKALQELKGDSID